MHPILSAAAGVLLLHQERRRLSTFFQHVVNERFEDDGYLTVRLVRQVLATLGSVLLGDIDRLFAPGGELKQHGIIEATQHTRDQPSIGG